MYKNGFTNTPQCYVNMYIPCRVIIWQHVSNNRDRPQAFIKIYGRRYGIVLIALVVTFVVHVACHVLCCN